MIFFVDKVWVDFLVFLCEVNGLLLVYFDSVVSVQKLSQVIDVEVEFYCYGYVVVYCGIYILSVQVIEKMENVCKRVLLFINVCLVEELVFVCGMMEGINLVVNSWGNSNVWVGDNIIISQMEYYVNIVFWQMFCVCVGVELCVILFNFDGML